MTPEEFVAEAERRLTGNKYAVERLSLRGAPAVVGRRKPWRVRWMFSQMKISVVVCAVEQVTMEGWLAFVNDATAVARAFPGGLPSGMSGFGAVPVLAAVSVDPMAASQVAATRPPVEIFQGLCMPGLVDLTRREAFAYQGAQFIGAIMVPFLKKQRELITTIR